MEFDVKEKVKEYYGGIASKVSKGSGGSCCSGSSCCGGSSKPAATSCCGDISSKSVIYAGENLDDLPAEAVEASLGCANPLLFAELKEGETVLDLGSGGGINVLMAARHVGSTGKVYGLDMTDEMLALANRNKAKMGVTNVEFLKGYIEDIPLQDETVDVIMSNCVVNLSEDKEKTLSEAYRVLKAGGRLSIADIISMREIPAELKAKAGMWCGCLGGTLTAAEYEAHLKKAGFTGIEVEPAYLYTRSVVEEFFLHDKYLRDSVKSMDLDILDGAFAGTYIRAKKEV